MSKTQAEKWQVPTWLVNWGLSLKSVWIGVTAGQKGVLRSPWTCPWYRQPPPSWAPPCSSPKEAIFQVGLAREHKQGNLSPAPNSAVWHWANYLTSLDLFAIIIKPVQGRVGQWACYIKTRPVPDDFMALDLIEVFPASSSASGLGGLLWTPFFFFFSG